MIRTPETLRQRLLPLGLIVLAALPAAGARAATPATANVSPQAGGPQLAGVEAQRQALFQKMMADPGNVELALAYAALSSKAGDLEGAISTLERLLIFAPTSSRLNFELGVLYYRLGAFNIASTYFATARDAADATPDVKSAAATYIAQAASEATGEGIAASIMFGARYQTNANGGADSPWVDLNGVEFLLNDAAMADPDANGFVAGTVHYSGDLASQGDHFVADVAAYGSLYNKHHELDTGAAEAQFGPVFSLERFSIAHSSLGFYGIFGGVGLKGDPYLYTAGAGTVLTSDFDPGTEAHLRLESRYEDYFNSTIRPTVSDMTGARTRLSGDIRHQLNDWARLYASIYGERKNAVAGFDADWETGAAIGTTLRFNGPLANQPRPWSFDLSAGVLERSFDANDPTISADRRHDREAFAQGTLTVPVGQDWSMVGALGYQKQMSSYDLYSFDNVSTSLAMTRNY
jgi:tetratricopeptide (TPR) repeat protein